MQFINESEREFTDISSEGYRVYLYPDQTQIQILNPQFLSVSASGNHYVVNAESDCYIIAPGWRAILWKTKPGAPHFVR